MKNRFVSLGLAVWLILSCALIPVSAIGNDIEYDYLLSIGVPASYLDELDTDELLRLYNKVYGKNYRLQSIENSVLSVQSQLSDVEERIIPLEDKLDLNMLVFCHSDPDEFPEQIYEVYIYFTYEWITGYPYFVATDAVTLNWDSSLLRYSPGSFYSYNEANPVSTGWYIYNTLSAPNTLEQGGLGYTIPISQPTIENGNARYFNLRGGCDVALIPTVNMYPGLIGTTISAKYGHATVDMDIQFSIGNGGMGVTITPSLGMETTTVAGEVYYELG